MIGENSYLAGLDIGSSKIAVAVGACRTDGRFDIYGVGLADTRGLRNGAVVDEHALAGAIASTVGEAAIAAGIGICEVHLGLSGSRVFGINARGVVRTGRLIDEDDKRRALDAAVNAVAVPVWRVILQVVPQDFTVDGQDGITRPEGLTIISPFEARAHVITCDLMYAYTVTRCVHLAGPTILSTRSSLMGTSEAVLTPDERELGVAVIDIGVNSTGIAIFERGLLLDTRRLDVGWSSFAHAVPDELPFPSQEAENLEQIFRRVYDALPEAQRSLNAGLVLTGEGSLLSGALDIAEQVFDLPVRRGCPAMVGHLAPRMEGYHFAAAVGLAQLAHRHDCQPSLAPRLPRPTGPWTG